MSIVKRNTVLWKILIAACTLFFGLISASYAANFDIVLQWDENTEPDLAVGDNPRYKLYYKTGSSGSGNKANYIGQPNSEPDVADEDSSPVSITIAMDESSDPEIVQFTLHNLEDTQDYYIAVSALDNYGNESDLSDEVKYEGVVSPPENIEPVLTALRVDGAENNDTIYTNNTSGEVDIQIIAHDADGTVNQYLILDNDNNPLNGTFTTVPGGADANKNFMVDFQLNGSGTHTIYAWVKDDKGSISAVNSKSNVILDRTVPPAPGSLDLSSTDDKGTSSTDNITNKTNGLTVSGTGETGSLLQLYDGATPIGDPVTVRDRRFSTDVSLSTGIHTIVARQTDPAGNVSENSSSLTITVDTSNPTGVISYNTEQTSHVDVGEFVITAIFNENLPAPPQITILGGGVMDITVPENMSGSGTVWTKTLSIPVDDNTAYSVSVSNISDSAGNTAAALLGNFISDTTDTDGDDVRDYIDEDDDNDGMPDTWEDEFGLDAKVDDAASDSDGDGITNLDEYLFETNPSIPNGNMKPELPVMVSPENDEIVSLTPDLVISEFEDHNNDDFHAETQWQIYYEIEGSGDCIYELRCSDTLTTLSVPSLVLDAQTDYAWRVRVYDNHGAASEWSDYGYFTTGENPADTDNDGIIDDQMPDPGADVDEDGTPDTEQINIKSIQVEGKGALIGLSTDDSPNEARVVSLQSSDPTDTEQYPEMTETPGNMPYGLIDFKVEVETPGDTAEITIFFSEEIAEDTAWYKYDCIQNTWEDFSAYTEISPDKKSMKLHLEDGGPGDSDGLVNGIIIDPSGLVTFSDQDDPDAPFFIISGAAGSSGCFINTVNVNNGSIMDKIFFGSFVGFFLLFLFINKDLKKQ